MVTATHDGVDTTGYRLRIVGAEASLVRDVEPQPGGQVTVAVAEGLPRGVYALVLSAFNLDGETAAPEHGLIVTAPPPAAPVSITITVIQ